MRNIKFTSCKVQLNLRTSGLVKRYACFNIYFLF